MDKPFSRLAFIIFIIVIIFHPSMVVAKATKSYLENLTKNGTTQNDG